MLEFLEDGNIFRIYFNERVGYLLTADVARGVFQGDLFIFKDEDLKIRAFQFGNEIVGKNRIVNMGLNVYDLIKPIDYSFSESFFVKFELEGILRSRIEKFAHIDFYHEGEFKTRICKGEY